VLRNAYLARPDLHGDQWAAEVATTQSPRKLTSALTASAHHPDVVAAAVRVLGTHPNLELARRLAQTPAPHVTRELAVLVTQALARSHGGASPSDEVLARLGPVEAERILGSAATENVALIGALARYDVAEQVALAALERVGVRQVEAKVVAEIISRRSGSALAQWISARAPGVLWLVSNGMSLLPWQEPATGTGSAPEEARRPGTISIREAVVSRDPRVLTSVVGRALEHAGDTSRTSRFERMAAVLLKNPHLPVADRHRLVAALGVDRSPSGVLDANR